MKTKIATLLALILTFAGLTACMGWTSVTPAEPLPWPSVIEPTGRLASTTQGTLPFRTPVGESFVLTTQPTEPSTAPPVTSGERAQSLTVLMYHQFYDPELGESPKRGAENNWMRVELFEAHVRSMKENGVYFPSMDEVEAFVLGTGTLPHPSAVITVDDGQLNFFTLAVPILEKYAVPAIGFVITDTYGAQKQAMYVPPWVSLQSHTHAMHINGIPVSAHPYEDIVADLRRSQELLGGADRVTVFAYPYGHTGDATIAALQETGFRLAFTTKHGRVTPGMDPLLLPRIRVNALDTVETLRRKIDVSF
ncbi:MAG: polysaccharide deacetylase family protein [Oscillospiraceae bacterium]|jgi:peptidoglycan/xylan/chitin deacetylase (PgdA/CDA1 family)|nr:polysaccharide deacetylase family protein [Oscillospiraceae bacterium]